MDRAEATGFGIAVSAHVALFAILSLSLAVTRLPPPPSAPIEVSFVKDVGFTNSAPQPSPAPPAQSAAPETGAPEIAEPEPLPPAPIPPAPAPAPPPPRAVETPAPKPAPRPAPKPPPARPAPPQAAAKPAPPAAKPAPAKAASQPSQNRNGDARATRGSRLSADFLKGIGSDPTPSQSQQAPAAVMSAEALAGITAAIARQIQPCANRQVNPGPGANQIKVTLNLRLNRDGSLARRPAVAGTAGVTPGNSRYEDRVKDLAVAAYVGCAPLRDLPPDLYQTPKGGWGNINMTYKLP